LAISISTHADPTRAGARRLPRLRTIALVAAASAILGIGLTIASQSSLFGARTIDVTGTAHLRRPEIIAASGLHRGTNVLWLDRGAVERDLERDPWMLHADVSVTLPSTITIAITERVPVAVANDGVTASLVAADGTILGSPTDGEERLARGLPTIQLPVAAATDGVRPSPAGAAVALGAMDDALLGRVDRMIVGANDVLEVRLDDGTTVRWGTPAGSGRKAGTLERALAWADAEGLQIARISVVAPAVPAVVFAP
jgi:cell division protein FtsQ